MADRQGQRLLWGGGGTIEVIADAQCIVPIHRLEVIFKRPKWLPRGKITGRGADDSSNGENQSGRTGLVGGAMFFAVRPRNLVAI